MDYLSLIKPRMVLGNLLIAAAAFLLASPTIYWQQLEVMLAGLGLVIAGGCALNNWYDRAIDSKMARTATRVLPAGRIAPRRALVFGVLLVVIGFAILWFTNPYALGAAVAGAAFYLLFYTPLKHHSGISLFVGAVAGATPPLVGYAAAAGHFDTLAWILFGGVYLWQLPHFIAISLYRFDEYAAAGVPLLVTGAPHSAAGRTAARATFFASLIVLMGASLAVIIFRLAL
ncbi:MAG: protoheme IX farnesyltransferase [Patescibacteria group bacterium]|nr:protoheme IX farnesyltransferase [Patescibacteria group bacterium]